MSWKTIKIMPGYSIELNDKDGYYLARSGSNIKDWERLCPDDKEHNPKLAEEEAKKRLA